MSASLSEAAEPTFPTLTGRVVDEAGLLTQAEREEIATTLRELEGKSTDQIVVVTLKSLQGYDIADYGYRLGRHWRIGQEGVNNGVLLIVAPNDRKARIEVGRGLEPFMTDTMSKVVIDNALLPAFRRGDFAGGIKAAVRDIRDILLGDAEAVKERARGGKRSDDIDWLSVAFILLFIAIIVIIAVNQAQQEQKSVRRSGLEPRRSRRSREDPVVIPSGSGEWDRGSSSPDFGWGGGGGDFGGGGSSGSW